MSDETAGEETPPLSLLADHIPAKMAMGLKLCELQHKANLLLGFPTLAEIGEIGIGARPNPIAVCGGGPTLNDTFCELQEFPGPVMACGSAHDHLVRLGVRLNYCALIDPDPIVLDYVTEDGGDCLYLVASHCAGNVLLNLRERGKRVALFGAGGLFPVDDFYPLPVVMAGGRTVGTRAMGLALALGYHELHLFGIDSCFREGETHAYTVNEPVGRAHSIWCGGRRFRAASYMIGQATDFKQFVGFHGERVGVHVHGDSLTAQIMKVAREIQEL